MPRAPRKKAPPKEAAATATPAVAPDVPDATIPSTTEPLPTADAPADSDNSLDSPEPKLDSDVNPIADPTVSSVPISAPAASAAAAPAPASTPTPASTPSNKKRQSLSLEAFASQLTNGRKRLEELSSEVRAAICAAIAAGQSKAAVARAFGVTRATVYGTLQRQEEFNTFNSRARSGRPKKVSADDERAISQLKSVDPKMKWKDVKARLDLDISETTFKRIMRKLRSQGVVDGGQGNQQGSQQPSQGVDGLAAVPSPVVIVPVVPIAPLSHAHAHAHAHAHSHNPGMVGIASGNIAPVGDMGEGDITMVDDPPIDPAMTMASDATLNALADAVASTSPDAQLAAEATAALTTTAPDMARGRFAFTAGQ